MFVNIYLFRKLLSNLSLLVCQIVEYIFDFCFSEFAEPWLLDITVSYFDLASFKVTGGNRLKYSDCCFNCLSIVPVSVILFELLFEMTHSFLFFGACRYSPEPNRLSRWIDSEALWAKLFIATYKSNIDAEWSDSSILRIFLKIASKSLSNDVNRCFIWELELVLSSLLSKPGDNVSCVVHVADNNGSAMITDAEDIADRVWHNQLVWNFLLATDHYGIFTSDGDWCHTCLWNSLECILHLVDSSVRWEHLHHFVHTHGWL